MKRDTWRYPKVSQGAKRRYRRVSPSKLMSQKEIRESIPKQANELEEIREGIPNKLKRDVRDIAHRSAVSLDD